MESCQTNLVSGLGFLEIHFLVLRTATCDFQRSLVAAHTQMLFTFFSMIYLPDFPSESGLNPAADPPLLTLLSGSRDDRKAGGGVSWLPDGPRGQLRLPVVQGLVDWDFETSGARMTSVVFLETNQELRRPEGHSNKTRSLYVLWGTFAQTLAQCQAVYRGHTEGQ